MHKEITPVLAIITILAVIVIIACLLYTKTSSARVTPDARTRHSQIGSKEAAEAIRNRIIERQRGQ